MARKPDVIKMQMPKIIYKIRDQINSKKGYWIAFKILLTVMFLAGIYLVVYPFLPAILFRLMYEGREIYPYETKLEGVLNNDKVELGNREIPEENRLVIPAINIDMPIVEGNNANALNLGVWHRPGTGFPGEGNMVLTGHRIGYAFLPEDIRNSTSFYHLDKLEIGDYVIVYWEKSEYDYEIYDSETTDPEAKEIESQEGEERLTLYTCDPIGTFNKRLVYYAEPIEIE